MKVQLLLIAAILVAAFLAYTATKLLPSDVYWFCRYNVGPSKPLTGKRLAACKVYGAKVLKEYENSYKKIHSAKKVAPPHILRETYFIEGE